MHLEPPVFRPPSEAFSLILQLTIGCRHNACTFCGMYRGKKFRIKDWEEIKQDIDSCAIQLQDAQRVFLADGDALAAPTSMIQKATFYLRKRFPHLQRISMYAGPKDILSKSNDELKEIRASGVKMLYLGLESGNEDILKSVCKGVTVGEMIEAGQKAIQTGFELSVTVINGLGGTELWEKHAADSGRALTAIDPHYAGLLTLMLVPNTPLYRQMQRGEFTVPGPDAILKEIKTMIEYTDLTNCVFRANHASNYLPLRGVLGRDKNKLLAVLDMAVNNPQAVPLRPERSRGL